MATESLEDLTHEVRHCKHCEGLSLPFVPADRSGWPTFRFPPTIGAKGQAPLLFVGINPRVSRSNLHLHKALIADVDVFVELSGNRYQGEHYIGPQGLERHYLPHVQIARKIFRDRQFEEVAAVTELFFCASESADRLPIDHSPCAAKYFDRVLSLVQPLVVFAVGRSVKDYMIRRFGSEHGVTFATWGKGNRARVVAMPHPNSRCERISGWDRAAECGASYLLSGESPHRENHLKSGSASKPLNSVDCQHLRSVTRPTDKAIPRVSYRSTRLHFKRSQIEPIDMEEEFEIVTPHASWRMTKADLCRVFPNVIDSQSYSGPRGEYFYPKPPRRAEQFRVR